MGPKLQKLNSLLYQLSHDYLLISIGVVLFFAIKAFIGYRTYRHYEDLHSILINGISNLRSEMEKNADSNERHNVLPWPFGEPLLPQTHLLNLIVHMYHHRGQLHLYLKQLGADVDTDTIYSE